MVERDGYDGFNRRLRVLGILMVLVIAVLIGRAGYLQIYEGEYYAGLADGNRIRIIPAVAPRGTFYDRNGQLLVTNRPGFTVSLLPLTSPIKEEVIERLSALVHVPVEDIKAKIAGHSGFDPIRIKADVTPDIVSIIEEQKELYPGVMIENTPIRDYVLKQEGAHTFGYVSEINDEELKEKKATPVLEVCRAYKVRKASREYKDQEDLMVLQGQHPISISNIHRSLILHQVLS